MGKLHVPTQERRPAGTSSQETQKCNSEVSRSSVASAHLPPGCRTAPQSAGRRGPHECACQCTCRRAEGREATEVQREKPSKCREGSHRSAAREAIKAQGGQPSKCSEGSHQSAGRAAIKVQGGQPSKRIEQLWRAGPGRECQALVCSALNARGEQRRLGSSPKLNQCNRLTSRHQSHPALVHLLPGSGRPLQHARGARERQACVASPVSWGNAVLP